MEPGVAGLAVRLSQLSSGAALALVVVDRAITYLSVIVVGAVVFLGRQAVRRPALVRAAEARTVEKA